MLRCGNCFRITRNPKYCSKRCAAIRNNHLFPKRRPRGRCKRCGTPLTVKRRICNMCRSRLQAWRTQPSPVPRVWNARDHRIALDLVGLALWWAEGDKNRWRVSVSNSDPDVIRLFVHWLREVYNVPLRKFRAAIQVHQDTDPTKTKRFWRRTIGITTEQFSKTIVKEKSSEVRERRLPYGTCKVMVHDVRLFDLVKSRWSQIQSLTGSRWSITRPLANIERLIPTPPFDPIPTEDVTEDRGPTPRAGTTMPSTTPDAARIMAGSRLETGEWRRSAGPSECSRAPCSS